VFGIPQVIHAGALGQRRQLGMENREQAMEN
jgi:hypothetical protein